MEARQGDDAIYDDAVDVAVLASGVNTIPLYEGYMPGYKALIPFCGRASIHHVLDALLRVRAIRKICIEGPRHLLEKELKGRLTPERVVVAEGGETFLDSLLTGLERFRYARSVLFVTADLPLITPEAVRDFLSGCTASMTEYEHNIHVAAVPQTSYTGRFQEFTKPFNRYRDITVCHGNLFLVSTGLLENQDLRRRAASLYSGRKTVLSRLALGWKLGLTHLIGVDLLHRVALQEMAAMVSRHLGIGICPVLIGHPEVTMDVDDADDYRFVQEWLAQKRAEYPVPCA